MFDRTIYVDLDGVMTDFDAHYTVCTGIELSWKDHNARKTSEPRNWWWPLDPHPTFYRDLPLMPGAMDLWEFLQPFNPYILSAMSSHIPASYQQKHDWVKEHLGIEGERVIIVGDRVDKPRYCHPGDILIDDQRRNVDDWNIEGGHGIWFRSAEQTIAELTELICK